MHTPEIILVEDDEQVSFLLRWQLSRAGYVVRSAPTIAAAREAFRESWDIAILDRNLPDGDGFELCRELREVSPHKYLILLTGEDSDEAKLDGFGRGADDYITKPFKMDELLARLRAGARIVELQKRLLESSLTDPLTSLRNRRAFDEKIEEAFSHARRYQRPLSLVLVDIDHFKSVNDRRGHDAGDAVLRGVAKLIGAGTRQSDFAARVGGEEFAILLPETALFEALQFSEKLRSTIGESVFDVTVSAGIASIPHSPVCSPAELFNAADQALYRAKANGRNRIELERRRDRQRIVMPRFAEA